MLKASIISSLIEVTITHPIDVYKTNLQLNKPTYLHTLYRGYLQRSLGNIPSRTIFLYSSEYMKNNNINRYAIPIISGILQTLADTPIENLKIRAINGHKKLSLYRGYIPHCIRNIIFIEYVLYFKENNKFDIFSGAVGGLVGSYISHPFDTIKTKVQSYNNFNNLNNINKIFIELFKGAHPRAFMAFINMTISLNCFVYIQNNF